MMKKIKQVDYSKYISVKGYDKIDYAIPYMDDMQGLGWHIDVRISSSETRNHMHILVPFNDGVEIDKVGMMEDVKNKLKTIEPVSVTVTVDDMIHKFVEYAWKHMARFCEFEYPEDCVDASDNFIYKKTFVEILTEKIRTSIVEEESNPGQRFIYLDNGDLESIIEEINGASIKPYYAKGTKERDEYFKISLGLNTGKLNNITYNGNYVFMDDSTREYEKNKIINFQNCL